MTFDDDYLQVENVLYDYCECLMLTNAVFNWPSAKEAESRDSPTVRLRISDGEILERNRSLRQMLSCKDSWPSATWSHLGILEITLCLDT